MFFLSQAALEGFKAKKFDFLKRLRCVFLSQAALQGFKAKKSDFLTRFRCVFLSQAALEGFSAKKYVFLYGFCVYLILEEGPPWMTWLFTPQFPKIGVMFYPFCKICSSKLDPWSLHFEILGAL